MTNSSAVNSASTVNAAGTTANGMRSEIATKWDKFNPTEVAGIKDKADLVKQVQTKYGLEMAQAQRDVDAFAKGRQL